METEHFDTERFIDEISRRPCIWDMECPEYKNKISKKRNWEEIVAIFGNSKDNVEQKTVLGSRLMKKWKNIRDNYIKESRRQKNPPSGSRSSKHSPYLYYKRLKFLEGSVANKNTESNYEATNSTHEDSEDLMLPSTETRQNQKLNAVDNETVELLQESLIARQQNEALAVLSLEDDDKLFCLSLYSELKRIPENRRLSAKIDLLNVIQRAQNSLMPL